MTRPTDNELASLAARGDTEAFDALASRHWGLAYRMAYRWSGLREDAEDIAQDSLIKMARAIGSFEGSSEFTTWLMRIVINTAKDHIRSSAARAGRELAYVTEDGPPHGNPSTPEDDLAARAVYRAIARLPQKLKAAVLLVYAEGMSHAEAARVLGCAETTVSWRVFQGRRRLKDLLTKGA